MRQEQGEYQQLNQDQSALSISKSTKRFKIATLVIGILGLIFLGLAAFFVIQFFSSKSTLQNKKNQLKQLQAKYSSLNPKNYKMSMADIRYFSIAIHPAPSDIPIKQLNFQNKDKRPNQLQDFNNNWIPGLQYLNLNGHNLSNFINNSLPDLSILLFQNYIIDDQTVFQQNFLPSIRQLRFTAPIYYFGSNTLNIQQLEIECHNFVSNHLQQLINLKITINGNFTLNGNQLPKLNQLQFNIKNPKNQSKIQIINSNFVHLTNITYQMTNSNYTWNISYNKYPELVDLVLNGNGIIDEFSSNQFPKLKNLKFNSSYIKINEFNNNNLPLIQTLTFPSNTSLYQFNNNILSSIKQLNLSDTSLNFFQKNQFKELVKLDLSHNPLRLLALSADKLQSLDLSYSSDLGGVRYLQLPQLVTLSVYNSPQLLQIDRIIANNLKQFKGNNCKIRQFINNQLGNVTSINLSNNNLSSFNMSIYPSLTNLQLSNNSIQNITIMSQTLQYLLLQNNKLVNVTVRQSKNLKYLNLQNNFLISFNDADVLNKIQQINLNHNELYQLNVVEAQYLTKLACSNNFLNRARINSPSLNILDLSYNALYTSFSDTIIPAITQLILNNNSFHDQEIANWIVSMNFANISVINLSNNYFNDTTKIKNILIAKYPNATITV